MQAQRGVARLTVVVAVVLALVLPLPAPASAAVSPVTWTTFGAVVVDHEYDRIFVSAGHNHDELSVLRYDGSLIKKIPDMPQGDGMVLVGSKLYVARNAGTAIDVVDRERLVKLDTLRLPYTSSGTLAYVAGRLWTTTDRCYAWSGLMAVNPRNGAVTTPGGPTFHCPTFKSSPLYPNWLFVADGSSPSGVDAIDVSLATPRVARGFPEDRHGDDYVANVDDFAVNPNGRHINLGTGYPYYVSEYRIANEALTGFTYPARASAVDVTDAGSGFFAAGQAASEGPTVQVFGLRSSTRTAAHNIGDDVVPETLKFAPDGGRLFAVEWPHSQLPFRLHVLPGPSAQMTTLSLSASRSTLESGESVRFTGTLGAAASANEEIELWAQPFGRISRRIATTTVDEAGNFAFAATPERSTTYFARWTGDADHVSAVSAPRRVRLKLVTTLRTYGGYKVVGKYRYFRVGRRAPMVASTMPKQPGQTMLFRVQRRRDGAWRFYEVARLRIPADGTLEAAFITDKRGRYRIRAEFSHPAYSGDVSPWRYLRMTR